MNRFALKEALKDIETLAVRAKFHEEKGEATEGEKELLKLYDAMLTTGKGMGFMSYNTHKTFMDRVKNLRNLSERQEGKVIFTTIPFDPDWFECPHNVAIFDQNLVLIDDDFDGLEKLIRDCRSVIIDMDCYELSFEDALENTSIIKRYRLNNQKKNELKEAFENILEKETVDMALCDLQTIYEILTGEYLVLHTGTGSCQGDVAYFVMRINKTLSLEWAQNCLDEVSDEYWGLAHKALIYKGSEPILNAEDLFENSRLCEITVVYGIFKDIVSYIANEYGVDEEDVIYKEANRGIENGDILYYLPCNENGDIQRYANDHVIVSYFGDVDETFDEYDEPYDWEYAKNRKFMDVVDTAANEYLNRFGNHIPKVLRY